MIWGWISWDDVLPWIVWFLIVSLLYQGQFISGNAGMTFYHGNGPGAQGIGQCPQGMTCRMIPVRVPCNRPDLHPRGHLIASQLYEELVLYGLAQDHLRDIGPLHENFPFCCYDALGRRKMTPEVAKALDNMIRGRCPALTEELVGRVKELGIRVATAPGRCPPGTMKYYLWDKSSRKKAKSLLLEYNQREGD